MHGINYEVVDLKDEFTLLEVACYWVDIPAYPSFNKIPDGKKSEVKFVADMLLQAGKDGRLKYVKPPGERQYRRPRSLWIAQGHRDLHQDYVGGPEYKIHEQPIPPTFHRAALMTFVEAIGQKPLFLFHEERRNTGQHTPVMKRDFPKLTTAQMVDYSKHSYLCYDRLHIPGTGQLKRSNDIIVNGHTVKIPDAQFRLLVELVVELKKGAGGWLTKDIKVGGYQGVDRLRKTIGGYLLEKDAKKFIENNASKQYRISTHPDFVTYDRDNLLKHADAEVRGLVEKLPKNGGVERRKE